MKRQTLSYDPGADGFGQTYTPDDAEQFETLMRYLDIPPGSVGERVTDNKTSSERSNFHYADNDERQFQELLDVSAKLSKSRASDYGARHKFTGTLGYNDNDQRQFSELLAAHNTYRFEHQASQIESDEPAFTYTEQDRAAFDALMPAQQEQTNRLTSDAKKPTGDNERRFVYIKIIDYVKEHAKTKENGTRIDSGLKIRYFD
jgi:hypothetical protein